MEIKKIWPQLLSVLILISLALWLPGKLSPLVLPLQPKVAYWHQLSSLNLNFTIPITGGSGPIGFYVSALTVFIAALLFLFGCSLSRWAGQGAWKRFGLLVLIIVGFSYNIILGSELLWGWQYGSVSQLAREALQSVIKDQSISNVITYYDTGGYELRTAGKYRNRLYTDERFIGDIGKSAGLISNYSGDNGIFLVVDFPEINHDSAYWSFFQTCQQTKFWRDRLVKAYVFDCHDGDRTLFEL